MVTDSTSNYIPRYRQQAQEASYMAYKRAIMAEIIENRWECGEYLHE